MIHSPLIVGDDYQGGKVAYIFIAGDPGFIDDGLQRGLICATADQSASIYWHFENAGVTGATGTALGTGLSNTDKIIALYGAENNAAKICRNYNGGGYSDWYLPSKNELDKLYLNRVVIGGFTTGIYFTSSEADSDIVWVQYFNTGYKDYYGKAELLYARAVRTFVGPAPFDSDSMRTWGASPKSAMDDERIEQAIARLIAVHEADAESHLGAGESMQNHKSDEVIDHPAVSVVRDKISFDRFQIDEHFNTLDAWGKSAGVTLDAIAQMTLYTGATINTVRYAFISPGDAMQDQAHQRFSPVFQTRILLSNNTSQLAYIMQGEPGEMGWGFKILNGTLYAYWITSGSTENTSSLGAISPSVWHNFRCELVYGGDLKFYFNDGLVHTVSNPTLENNAVFFQYYLKNTASSARYMYVNGLHFDAEYY